MSQALPVMVFDGDCRFCRHWIARWRRRTKSRVTYIPYQRLGRRHPEIPRADCKEAVQFLESGGRLSSGADAIVRLFDYGLPGGRLATFLASHPPLIWILRAGYRIVARRRSVFSRFIRSGRKA
jgi:predicted DCC family thiol-disulfide oxidoreductase YuxK